MLGALDRTRCRLVMKLSTDGLWGARTGIRTRRSTLDETLDLRDPRRARARVRAHRAGNKDGNDQKRNIRSTHETLQRGLVAASAIKIVCHAATEKRPSLPPPSPAGSRYEAKLMVLKNPFCATNGRL